MKWVRIIFIIFSTIVAFVIIYAIIDCFIGYRCELKGSYYIKREKCLENG